jgi:hypothetical protein
MLLLRHRIRVEYGPPHVGTCGLLAAHFPPPSSHTVVDDALQISHYFDSLFLVRFHGSGCPSLPLAKKKMWGKPPAFGLVVAWCIGHGEGRSLCLGMTPVMVVGGPVALWDQVGEWSLSLAAGVRGVL